MSIDNLNLQLNKMLLDCIESIDRELKTTEELENLYKEMQNFCLQNGLKNIIALEKLSSYLFCPLCKDKIGQVVLECRHFLCKSCLKYTVTRQTNNLIILNRFESQYSPLCPVYNCGNIIQQKYYKSLFENKFELESESRQREIQKLEIQSKKKMCDKCNKFRRIEYFFFNCKHICLFCNTFDINNYINCCSLCEENKESEIFINSISNIKCSKCGDTKYFENFFMEVCDDYVLCVNCLKEYWENVNCFKCNRRIHLHENFELVRNHLFKTCDCCQNCVTVDFIRELGCCSFNACFFCLVKQTNPEVEEYYFGCPYCETSVGPDVVHLINKILFECIAPFFKLI